MDYNKIENLVVLAKEGDKQAKEALANEFKPIILNISKKTYISSYEFSDIENECYKTLFTCVNRYNLSYHRFVAYATIAIKNSVINLIRISNRKSVTYGPYNNILNSNLYETLPLNLTNIDDIIIAKINCLNLRRAIKNLDSLDQDLLVFVYFERRSLKKYSEYRGISYSSALSRKSHLLTKLKATHIQL